MVEQGLDMDSWLASTAEKRSELLAYSRSPIPTDPGERQLDVSRALEYGQDAGDLLADAEVHLALAMSQAILEARKDHDAATARVLANGSVSGVTRLRDGISVLYRTIKDRRFALMNLNRS